MAEMRLGRGWSVVELSERLKELAAAPISFAETALADMTPENGWRAEFYETVIGREEPGEPVRGGAFDRVRAALSGFEMSDPAIVEGHFDPLEALIGRRILLDIK